MEATASRTAWSVAQRRAAHQVQDRPLIFEDPLALRIVGGDWQPREDEPPSVSPGFRSFMAVRSRYSEDALKDAYARGVRQFVVLGAGLDTFAYRNPFPDLRVFEVDHPATQEWKKVLLERAAIATPAGLTFVPVNFETESLIDRLQASGFRGEPAFFSWLGVTTYLSREAFDSTVGFIAGLPKPSGVVFDYVILRSLMSPAQRMVVDALSARVARAGEPFRLFFDPNELAGDLRGLGFTSIEDLAGEEIDARYFSGRSDGLSVKSAAARLLKAFIE
jgi:methyltransferase (TIGR00027 family)